jgi:hypothetical protein
MIVVMVLLQILSCLNNPAPPTLLSWTLHRHEVLSNNQWQAWQELDGRSLWLGYANGGWETTGDERWAGRLIGDDYEVWLFYSPTRQEYDLLPFADTRLFADANGEHYGMHPCGGWAVNEDIINAIIESDTEWTG